MKKTKSKMKLPPPSSRELSAKDRGRLAEELRYYTTKGVLKDFPTARDRKVMAALWKWLSLNGVVAWSSKKDRHVYDTIAWGPGRRRRKIGTSEAVVFTEKRWRDGEAAFSGKKKR